MVYITHVRFAETGNAPEDIVMLRWREAMGDTNVADMIEWIEGGGVAKIVTPDADEQQLTVVREAGRKPYLTTVAGGQLTHKIVELPRF